MLHLTRAARAAADGERDPCWHLTLGERARRRAARSSALRDRATLRATCAVTASSSAAAPRR
ncbi:hypothetical protein BE11_48790 [Sorangium cellulosum]|nr:hypothetical protein BE11_48790 [Sorangium cellulosum]